MPITSKLSCTAPRLVIARMTAFSPGQSPPLVSTPILRFAAFIASVQLARDIPVDTLPKPTLVAGRHGQQHRRNVRRDREEAGERPCRSVSRRREVGDAIVVRD